MDRHLAESLGSILSANHKRLMAGFGVIVCALSPLAALCERTNDRAAPALGADRAGPAYETRSSSRRSPGSRSRADPPAVGSRRRCWLTAASRRRTR